MSNPLLSKVELSVSGSPLTINGVINKTLILLAISSVTALTILFFGLSVGLRSGAFFAIFVVGMLAGIAMAVATYAKPHTSNYLAIPYAVCQGLVLGGVSGMYTAVALSALCATFITATGMLVLYKTGVIKVTDKFRSIVTSATIAIMILYAVQWVMSLMFSSSLPMLFDGGIIAIGFSLFVIVIASFNLLLDFDNIETAQSKGVSDDMEWLLSMGLLMTLVWMFVEFVRLLNFLED